MFFLINDIYMWKSCVVVNIVIVDFAQTPPPDSHVDMKMVKYNET